jgi:hypothetical protein
MCDTDLIDEVTDGERVNVYAEDSLLYGIREYNANICLVTEGERGYLYHIITEDDPNASGNLMLGILVNAKIDYIAVRKEYSGAKVALNSGGCVKVGQTDNYALYYVDQERSQADLYHTYNSSFIPHLFSYFIILTYSDPECQIIPQTPALTMHFRHFHLQYGTENTVL